MEQIKITFFIKGIERPIVLSHIDKNKCIRYMRKIFKQESGIIEIQLENDILFVDRQDIISCLITITE